MEITKRPYELLVRFGLNGTVQGAIVRMLTTVDGKDFEGDPIPLNGTDDPVFAEFAQQFSAAVVEERDNLLAEKEQLRDDLLQARRELNEARELAEQLAAQLVVLGTT